MPGPQKQNPRVMETGDRISAAARRMESGAMSLLGSERTIRNRLRARRGSTAS